MPGLDLVQRTLDDHDEPIARATFCVLDVETTGGSPSEGAITEVAVVRVRGGAIEDTFQTLVDPGIPIPRFITAITGIHDETVADAPAFGSIVDDLATFVDGAVVVGHNIGYDVAFLASEFERSGRQRLANRTVCTLALARRLVRDEVPDCKLGTLARHFRVVHQPTHRALADTLATTDLFMALLERAAGYGIETLEDLFTLPRLVGRPQGTKIRLAEGLPHAPGVYLFRDRSGNVLYVGKATDLRSRVRSYFTSDERRKIPELLRATATIDHEVCAHPLAAAVREVRLIAEHLPRFNSRSTRWRSMAYVRLTDEPYPRLSVVRTPPPPNSTYLGPLPSAGAAHRLIDAVTAVVPLRRCTLRSPRIPPAGQLDFAELDKSPRTPCVPAQLGLATCPCAGGVSLVEYAALCKTIHDGFTIDPDALLGPLRRKLMLLADRQRFEEAAELRDAAATLADAIRRRRRLEAWRTPRRIVVERDDGGGAELAHGLLAAAWGPGEPHDVASDTRQAAESRTPLGPVPRQEAYERLCIITELEHSRSPWHVVWVDGPLIQPSGRVDLFSVDTPEPHRRDR